MVIGQGCTLEDGASIANTILWDNISIGAGASITRSIVSSNAIIGGNQCTALDVSNDGHTLVFSDFLDSRMRVYSVPDYETLAAGNGGRWDEHLVELAK